MNKTHQHFKIKEYFLYILSFYKQIFFQFIVLIFMITGQAFGEMNLNSPPPVPSFNYSLFSQIPVLHQGRIKPLSTFSREHLLAFYGKSSLPDSSAESWLAEVLFNPQLASNRKIFKIRNPEIRDALDLKDSSLHSFNEISKSIDKILPLLNKIKDKSDEEKTLVDRQLLSLYMKVLTYFQLSRSFSLILPLFSIDSSLTNKDTLKKKYNYLEMLKFQQDIKKKIKNIKKEKFSQFSAKEKEIVALSFRLDLLSKDEDNDLFKIIPPLWKDNKELWHSPWELIRTGRGSPASARYLDKWIALEKAYRTKTNQKLVVGNTYREAINLSKKFARPKALYIEKISNNIDFFKKSLIFYIIGFLLMCLSGVLWKSILFKLSFLSIAVGVFLHLTGIVFRVFIMARPPVATLYESIIFVNFIVILCALFLEYRKKEGWGLLMGALAGPTLHLIALKYKGIESMELLVPVLNTNFWLATHVICITIGYGCSLITSFMGHIYVFLKCLGKSSLSSLYKNMTAASFFALFFCLLGTILGGIWADQSWGRFWGWDPKENGALLIVIWFLVLLHGRMAGLLKETGFAMGLILTNITVALSWFGVNLLSVGLHSYGFTNGIVWGLALFCGTELAIFFSALGILKWRTK